jgi:hypothetical protein
MSKECILSILDGLSETIPPFDILYSIFEILRFAVWARGVSHELQCVALSIWTTDHSQRTMFICRNIPYLWAVQSSH